MLLTTSKGSRAGFPDYGCDITSIVFDSLDEFTETIIKQEIVDSISKYEKRVKLLSVNLDRREDSFSVVVRLKYEVLLSGGSSLVVDDII
jgi:phage baseplate assembly protein W